MTTSQNITLAIPKDLLRKAKILAAQKNTSLSDLPTQILVELVANEGSYLQARQRNLKLLDHSLELGAQGEIIWKRKELHER